MAPRRKIASAQELEEKIAQFIQACDKGEIDKPTDYRLCEFLGISADTLERWEKERDKYQGYADCLKKLTLYREHYWLSAADDRYKQSMAIFALKQPKNGGYQDKQDVHHDAIKLEVTVNGVKDAFG